jgi:hypothetical protein
MPSTYPSARRSAQPLDDMAKAIASVAAGSIVVVLVFWAVIFLEMHLGLGQDLSVVEVEDPYRMRRTLENSLSTFAYATATLLYYALGGSALFDRWTNGRYGAATKAAILALPCWLLVAAVAAVQVGADLHLTLRLAAVVAIPMFFGTYAMLRVMSSNKSLERTHAG